MNVVTLSGDLGNGTHAWHVVSVNGPDSVNPTVLDGVTVTGGQGTGQVGGGMLINNINVVIANTRIVGNQADYGGGVFQSGSGRVDVIGSLIASNAATYDGGGLYVSGAAALTDTQVLSNTARRHGGGLHVLTGPTSLAGGLFGNNAAALTFDGNGGGANVNNGVRVSGTQFISNTATNGGGLQQWNAGYTVTLTGARFERNVARAVGGGAAISGTLVVSASAFVSNTVSLTTVNSSGGGVFAGGTATIAASTFVSNVAYSLAPRSGFGGGAYVLQSVAVQDSTFEANYGWFGGGVYSNQADVARSAFRGNNGGYGAGVNAYAIWISGTEFLSNRAMNRGGAVRAVGAVITATRFISNAADAEGGGAVSANSLDAVNALFVGNRSYVTGAAIYLDNGRSTLRHVTVAHPGRGDGPAIRIVGGTATLTDTIVVSHTSGISLTGNTVGGTLNVDYALFYAASVQNQGGTLNLGTHILNADPRFANPAGGDYHLTVNSPAVDTGTYAGITTDLDGRPRPMGGGYDLGAYEYVVYRVYVPSAIR